MQSARVRTVRLVHQHQDFFRVIELWELFEADVLRKRDFLLDDFFVLSGFLFFTNNRHGDLVSSVRAGLRKNFARLAVVPISYDLILLKHCHNDVWRWFAYK